jgi:hypothetical protein
MLLLAKGAEKADESGKHLRSFVLSVDGQSGWDAELQSFNIGLYSPKSSSLSSFFVK